jgi:hypothetical protein
MARWLCSNAVFEVAEGGPCLRPDDGVEEEVSSVVRICAGGTSALLRQGAAGGALVVRSGSELL